MINSFTFYNDIRADPIQNQIMKTIFTPIAAGRLRNDDQRFKVAAKSLPNPARAVAEVTSSN
jgi:hypothetical protein